MHRAANRRASRPGTRGAKKPRKVTRPHAPRTTKRLVLAIFKWTAIGGFAAAALAAASVALLFWVYGRDARLPNLGSASEYEPLQVTRVVAADGTVVGELYKERRTFVAFDAVPRPLIDAFVSAEDANFWDHEGIDYWGMVRALFVNVKAGKKKQGASTITQQVVKTFFLSPEKSLKRKVQEIILARRLESRLSKEDILTLYMNQIYFGHGRYGVQEAARYYFGKDVADLTVGEAAVIAGLPQAPEKISPRKNPGRAKARQKYVLEQMAYRGHISEQEAQKWINEPIRLVKDAFPELGAAPEWIELVRQSLMAEHGEARLHTLGARVVTTLDPELQRAATAALRDGLRAVDARRGYGRPARRVKRDKIDLEVARLARRLPGGGPERGKRYDAVIREVYDDDAELVVDLGKWRASVVLPAGGDERYNPDGAKPGERFQPGDVVRVLVPSAPADEAPRHTERAVSLAPGPEGAVVVIEPATRRVIALVGGYDSAVGDFNRAVQARRQPGSTFKPFVYAAAIESGAFTAASIVNDAPEVYDLWRPENYKKGKFAGPVRLREALARSINTVAIRVLYDVGPARVVELARATGISSDLPSELSLALGSGEVSPLELTNAFATLAAGGMAAPPRFIESIDDREQAAPEPVQALSPEVAYIVTDMMRSVVEEGTATKARSLRMNVAGKTGTSNDVRDAWFVGMTPQHVVGVWVGFDDNSPLGGGEAGGTTALPVFIDVMKEIGKDTPRREFARPAGVVAVDIDRASGLLAPEGADKKATYREVFVDGTAPTELALAPGEAAASEFVLDEYGDEDGGGGSGDGDGGGGREDEGGGTR